jgi:acyl carrier protein
MQIKIDTDTDTDTKTYKDVFHRVSAIVTRLLSVDPKQVELEADFSKDLGADSLDIVELILSFEEEFNIVIPDEAASEISTIEQAVKYIVKKIRET